MSKTQAMFARQQSLKQKGDPAFKNRLIEEQALGGFYSARNEFDVRRYMTKPLDSVPVTNLVSRLVSGIGSANISHDNASAPDKWNLIQPFANLKQFTGKDEASPFGIPQ